MPFHFWLCAAPSLPLKTARNQSKTHQRLKTPTPSPLSTQKQSKPENSDEMGLKPLGAYYAITTIVWVWGLGHNVPSKSHHWFVCLFVVIDSWQPSFLLVTTSFKTFRTFQIFDYFATEEENIVGSRYIVHSSVRAKIRKTTFLGTILLTNLRDKGFVLPFELYTYIICTIYQSFHGDQFLLSLS
jgi:hypothetical protein